MSIRLHARTLERVAGMLTLMGSPVACAKKTADPPLASISATEVIAAPPRASASVSPPSRVAASAAPSSSVAAVPEGVLRDCKSICAHSDALKCAHADECLSNCVAAAAVTPCAAEFQALYGCLVPQPLKNWRCEEDGVAAIREGFCEPEQQASFACMQQKMKD